MRLVVTVLAMLSCEGCTATRTMDESSTTSASVPAAAPKDIKAGNIFASRARLEVVFDNGFFLEGPAQGPDGKIYFSDITQSYKTKMQAGYIWQHDPKTRQTRIFRSPSGMSNGLAFDRDGRMIAAHGADFGARMVTRTDMSTGRATIVAGLYNGRAFNAPNDVDLDEKGRIYFTDPRYFGWEPLEQPVQGVYRIDNDGKVALILADVSRPNGIAVSPDQKSLYVSESNFLVTDMRIDRSIPRRFVDMTIREYDLSPDGLPSNPRVFIDYGAEGGGSADGIEVDSAGNLYAAIQTSNHGVRVYDPQGREIASVKTPEMPSNLTIAQIDGKNWLYITGSTTLYRIETLIPARKYTNGQATRP